jgi:N4-gp56 family major capsid protein
MADALTTTASLDSDQAAYDRAAYFALRPELYFDRMADVKPTHQSMPGTSVKFTQYADMSVATTALNESVDVDAVALDDAQVEVTLVEQGNAILTTAKIRATSFLNIDMDAANIVGQNAGLSLDTLARTPLIAGTNVLYSGNATARNTVGPDDTLSAANVRKALARLVAGNVQRWTDGYYKAVIHPDTSYDLRSETGAAAWRDPHTYSQPGDIWTGSVGAFEGFEFLESPRAAVLADAGSSTTLTDVYITLFMGRQALAKAYSTNYGGAGEFPVTVRGAVVDKLSRFHPLGWKWLGGYGRFREACLYRYESSSTIGVNA